MEVVYNVGNFIKQIMKDADGKSEMTSHPLFYTRKQIAGKYALKFSVDSNWCL